MKQTILTEMKIILNLNQYVKQTCEKTIYPLRRDNDCKDTKMNTTRWEFVTEDPPQNKEEWKELIEWKIDETNPRQTIPVYGKLKVQENNIYLLVYMKYIKLREITQEKIDKAQGLEKNMKYIELEEITQEKIDKTKDLEKSLKYIKLREIEQEKLDKAQELEKETEKPPLSATERQNEDQYYSCTIHLGPFTKDKLTNRSRLATLNFGVNLQDIIIQCEPGSFKLYKTLRGGLTYMEEEQYKKSVRALTGRNREFKLHGQSKEGRKQDPRK